MPRAQCPHFVVEQRPTKLNFGGNQCAFFVKVYPLPHPMSNTACAKGSALVSIPCLFSKENEENADQAMLINGALPPVESKVEHRWKHPVETNGDTPMAETPQPHHLPVPWQTAICLVGCGLAGVGEGGVWKQQWKQR